MITPTQIVLDGRLASLSESKSLIWTDTLMIPSYVALASVVVLLLHVICLSRAIKNLYACLLPGVALREESSAEEQQVVHPAGFFAEAKNHVLDHGGLKIFLYKVTRLAGCLVFLALASTTLILHEGESSGANGFRFLGKWSRKPKHGRGHRNTTLLSQGEWLHVAICATALYASCLAIISVFAKLRCSKLVAKHTNVIMLAFFGVYVYRDIWPLTTFTLESKDTSERWILVAKVTILFITAVGVPLFIPRRYIPVDPKEPMPVPNPEQTASLFSLLIYTFLDPIIFLAYRIPHLSHDQLPPLADYDYSKNLSKHALPILDPFISKSRRHIFFRLMRVFRTEYITLAVMLVIQVIGGFANPLGINRLLNYLEKKGEDAVVRPWVWIAWLFVGPTIVSIAFQWYIFIATRTLVRTESIITQLVFDHSLRIRMKAEVAKKSSSEGDSTVAPTPDRASTPDVRDVQEQSNGSDETLQSSSSSVTSATSKGKQKVKDSQPLEEAKKSDDLNAGNLVGKINNLVTTDLNNITNARDFLYLIVYIPLQIALCITFLYIILGWSSFVGLLVMLLLFPLPGYIAKLVQDVQAETMKTTDARVQTVTETMGVIRMIKLFGWEFKLNEKIAQKREDELKWIWRRQLLELLNNNINYIIPLVTMVATYTTYTLVLKQDLSASKVFSSMSVFDMLREQLHISLYVISSSVRGKVSLDRVDDFLSNTELLDEFTEKAEDDVAEMFGCSNQFEPNVIGIRNATFSWSNEQDGTLTPSRQPFKLRIDELIFRRGCINLIIGPTGSGKTSLLMALLGEMHFIPSSTTSTFNLPRGKGIAYAAQESWVQNETIRDNILFGAPFDEIRYKKVLHQCALERDISLFEAGDRTEVGEKGLTLSGGQKARITLARAVYSSADILLLDDVLAALDVHTAKWIINKCFSGDLLQGRTVLLVTHNVAMAGPIADFVVSLGKDGRILSQGSVSDALAKDRKLAAKALADEQGVEKAEEEIDPAPAKEADGKLVLKEEIEEGHVSWSALMLYLSSMSRAPGFHPFFFWFIFLGGMVLCDAINTIQTWFLGYWASQYADHEASEIPVTYYLSIYSLLLVVSVILYCAAYLTYVFGSLRASRKIHLRLVQSVLGTTLRWLDTTPTSRIIARCTQDIATVDGPISQGLGWLLEMTLTMLIKFGAVVLFTPIFVIPGIILAILGGLCSQIYIKAQLSVKREMSNARSPVLGHFGAAIAGLASIRAYGAQQSFKKESMERIDRYTRAGRTFYNLNRWVCIRIDAMGGLFASGLAWYLIYGPGSRNPANTGFSLNQAMSVTSMILWWVRMLNDFEVNGNSLERIRGYITIEQEPKPTDSGKPPAYWPASGDLRVENLSARYSNDGPNVLHNLHFHIRSGERVGVVGRTGSGKSSLTLSLLRCIPTEGTTYFDGLPTNSVNLEALRTSVTIIPQVPELLSGTLRANLDPFDQYDDAKLNDALRAAGLFSLQDEDDEGRITLDSAIASGGGNLSVGQRQILALARAILRGSKLLILDEATSAIDYKTDSIIQSSLRNELGNDVTLLTVAHRLQTIMDADRIMVLDAGRIVEFDKPNVLLKNEKGMLRALVNESVDKDILYEMAEGIRGTSQKA